MSDTEEPPTKLSKMDNGDDDNTDASFDDEPVTGMNMPEITNLPEITDLPETNDLPETTDLPEATDLPAIDLPETTEASGSFNTDMPAIELPDEKITPQLSDLPEIVNLPDITNLPEIGLPELSTIPEVSAASNNLTDISETAEISQPIGAPGETAPETDPTALESDSTAEMVEDRLQESLGSQDGQNEEWLSEGVLTDDDFNTSAEATNANITTTTANTNGLSEPTDAKRDLVTKEIESKPTVQNIEDALNSLEGGMEGYEEYLVEKKDVKSDQVKLNTQNNKEDDDGNDTDDLLRMLGGDDNKSKKKLTKTVKDLRSVQAETSSSEDEFEARGSSAKKLKLAKALVKKEPKPVHEESDGTSDDTVIMKKMMVNKRSSTQAQEARARVLQSKASVNVGTKNKKDKIATSTPLRAPVTRSLLKPGVNTARAAAAQPKANYTPVQVKKEPNPNTYSRVNKATAKKPPPSTSIRAREVRQVVKEDSKEELDEEYHLNEEESDSEEEPVRRRQNSLKEDMDEDMLSDADGESHSEDGSLYDELPSSDSDDIDDWFQLDIRAEKAGDYLPLLGTNAKEVLLEEKSRVAERLSNLRKSLSALTESGKKQAEQVRTATLSLAELDDLLKAA